MEKEKNRRLPFFILMIILNLLPVGVAALIYRSGAPLLIPVLLFFIITLPAGIFFASKKWQHLLILSIELTLSIAAANILSGSLYFNFISSDDDTIFIVFLMTLIGVLLTAEICAASVVAKVLINKFRKKA